MNATLTLTFAQEVEITAVEILPGYAKIDAENGVDRFKQNRRVKRVRVEAGGQQIEANLEDRPELQPVNLNNGSVRATTITITILETTAPGSIEGRDFTPISEIVVMGKSS